MSGRAAYIRPRLARAPDLIERVGLHKGDFWPGAEDDGQQIGEPNLQAWSDHPELTTEAVVETIRAVIA